MTPLLQPLRSSRLRHLTVLSLLALSITPLFAAKKKEASGEFTLQSELLRSQPEISAALEAMKAAPQDPKAWSDLGHALVAHGGFQDAVSAFARVTTIAPNDANGWVDMGAATLRLERVSKAKAAFKKALEIEPFHAVAYYDLGLAYQQEGQYENAIDAFEKALLIDPSLGDPTVNAQSINNPDIRTVLHRVYMRTTGAAPALFSK